MSEDAAKLQLVQAPSAEPTAVEPWEQAAAADDAAPAAVGARAMSAIRRYRWLIVAVFVVAVGAGFVATRFITPIYDVHATIWIQAETPMSQKVGAFKSEELLNSQAWVELLMSHASRRRRRSQACALRESGRPGRFGGLPGFAIADRFVPGHTSSISTGIEAVAPADGERRCSRQRRVCRLRRQRIGFRWQLGRTCSQGAGTEKILFTVLTPRETAIRLHLDRLTTKLADKEQLPHRFDAGPRSPGIARTINAWMHEYVDVAQQLKKAERGRSTPAFLRASSALPSEACTNRNKLGGVPGPRRSRSRVPRSSPIAPGVQADQRPGDHELL